MDRAKVIVSVLAVVAVGMQTYFLYRVTQESAQSQRAVAVSDIILGHYVDRSASQQGATISYLRVVFPDAMKEAERILLKGAKSADVVGQVAPKEQSRAARADTAERAGFEAILGGDLAEARRQFGLAYREYQVYHNVDEIYRQVLAKSVVDRWATADDRGKSKILRSVLDEILGPYAWGMPDDIKVRLEQQLADLRRQR